MLLTIENDGQEITATNFWQTEQARRGSFYLSTNAGAFRLLVPEQHKSAIAEFKTAKDVILTRGPYMDQANAMEILWDPSDFGKSDEKCLHSSDRHTSTLAP
jgi:hypothetical protein